MGRTKQLRRLLAWLWGLRKDKRWVENTKISTALWILNFGLFYIGVTSFTSNTWLTNLVLSLSWDVVWYFINRFHLWKERDVTTGVSASYSAGAWLFFFVLNQSAFWLLVGHAEVDWYYAKPLLTVLSIAFGLTRYLYNDKVTFAEETAKA